MEKYLNRAIDSILDQVYQDYEVICVNDGSTDNSGTICNSYLNQSEKISVIHKTNAGLSSARNTGILKAAGKFVIFPDPDDWVESNYLQVLYDLLMQYSADIAICGHFVENKKQSHIHNNKAKATLLNRHQALELLLRPYSFCGFAHTKLYNLCIIKKFNLMFKTEFGTMQDLYFSFQYLLKCDRIAYNPVPTYHYFQHDGGITNSRVITERKLSGLLVLDSLKELTVAEFRPGTRIVCGTIANYSLSLIFIHLDTKYPNHDLLKTLKQRLKENRIPFLISKNYSISHKLLFCIACISIKLYYFIKKIKNKFTRFY